MCCDVVGCGAWTRLPLASIVGWVVLLMRALAARARDDNGADNVGIVVMQGKCGADLGTVTEAGEHLRDGALEASRREPRRVCALEYRVRWCGVNIFDMYTGTRQHHPASMSGQASEQRAKAHALTITPSYRNSWRE